eukprot:412743_1
MFRRKKYEKKRWRGGSVVIRTNNGYIDIQHNKEKNILEFYGDELGTKQFENIQQLLNIFDKDNSLDKQAVYLEWVQSNGSYYYFNLAKVIEQTQNHILLDINILNIVQTENKDIDSKENKLNEEKELDASCYFDESILIETKLSTDDILIISPLKSMNLGYSDMGTYNKYKLFLGRRPTEKFIETNKIVYIINCCLRRNDENITKLCKERNFNVAKWQWKGNKKKYTFIPLKEKDEQTDELKQETQIKMNGKEYLDAMIDEINEYITRGNVLIHCLAGAHRSPFITACYLSKYGGFRNKTATEIYTFMKNRRSVVEELGFDNDLKKYQIFLKTADKTC